MLPLSNNVKNSSASIVESHDLLDVAVVCSILSNNVKNSSASIVESHDLLDFAVVCSVLSIC